MVEAISGKEVPINPLTPEQIGFRKIEGLDILPPTELPHTSPHQQIAALSIDRTVDRRTQWQRYLNKLEEVALDPEQRRSTVTNLIEAEKDFVKSEELAPHIADVFNLTRSIVGNYDNPTDVKRALQNANNASMQESIVKAGEVVLSHFSGNHNSDLVLAVSSVLGLA